MNARRPQIWVVATVVLLAVATGLWMWLQRGETTVVMRINGVPISQQQIDSRIGSLSEVHGDLKTSLGPDWRDRVLTTLIDDVIVQQEAENANITVVSSELDSKVEAIQNAIGGEDDWREWLEKRALTEEQLRERVHDQMLAGMVFSEAMVTEPPTKEEMEAYYQEHLDQYILDGEPRSFIEVRDSVEAALVQKMQDEVLSAWLRARRDAAEVEILDDDWG